MKIKRFEDQDGDWMEIVTTPEEPWVQFDAVTFTANQSLFNEIRAHFDLLAREVFGEKEPTSLTQVRQLDAKLDEWGVPITTPEGYRLSPLGRMVAYVGRLNSALQAKDDADAAELTQIRDMIRELEQEEHGAVSSAAIGRREAYAKVLALLPEPEEADKEPDL